MLHDVLSLVNAPSYRIQTSSLKGLSVPIRSAMLPSILRILHDNGVSMKMQLSQQQHLVINNTLYADQPG
jgi:hypothetical protein